MAVERTIGAEIQTRSSSRGVDESIAALASRQHGVVSRAQLLALGLGIGAIKHRIALGRLQPLRHGVYAIGHRAVRREAWWMASVLASGPETVLSGRSAAALWSMRPTARAAIEVIAPRKVRVRGIDARCISLPADEVTIERGIPGTTPARTLFDLAAVLPPHQLEAAFNEAEYRRLTSPVPLDALLARYPRRRGTDAIRRVLVNHRKNGETRTRSDLERHFLALVDAYGLPRPKVNRTTDDGELDATWPEQRLVVECDGFAAHWTREAFERDRAKDRALQTAGWRVIRLTWRQLDEEPITIAKQLATLLAAGT